MGLADLSLVRQGTDYFLRTLDNVTDDQFALPSLLPGWSRSHVIAHVAFNADALARLTESARTGIEQRMYESVDARDEQIARGAARDPDTVRALVRGSADRLAALWNSMRDDEWNAKARMLSGRLVPASSLVWMRAREVWLHAVDLDDGGTFSQFPAEFVDRLLAEIVDNWRSRDDHRQATGVVLAPDDRDARFTVDGADGQILLRGTAAGLLHWATGRGASGVTVEDRSDIPDPAPWL